MAKFAAYHAKFLAWALTRAAPPGDVDQVSMGLFDASVDLNPHQIEAALFALHSPTSGGVILADEVGLGKTVEAGIVLCQRWAERRRRLLVIAPASIRKQWASELSEKFSLPSIVLDSKTYADRKAAGFAWPFHAEAVVVVSYHFAAKYQDEIRAIAWDLIVIDEAHKLRNSYRPSNRIGQALRFATEGRPTILLTATPLQNSLMELYGLASFIDEHLFGDAGAFRSQYTGAGADISGLRARLADICKRTLRKDVLEYVRYTDRIALTQPFQPTVAEQRLYDGVTAMLQRVESYALPSRQRHLIILLLRKLLASSSSAIAGTLASLRDRLIAMRDDPKVIERWAEGAIGDEDFEADVLDEWLGPDDDEEQRFDPAKLRQEIDELDRLARLAADITEDAKSGALLTALRIGFSEQDKRGAPQKALIFTESRRTQAYLQSYLEANGYAGDVVAFNGSNSSEQVSQIYERWKAQNAHTGKPTGSRAIDVRTALTEHFRDRARIMLATEAAAEGVNMQFCAMVINYDLPWNPQRIEQRIGRCHRYGQRHDVIVINFLNEKNAADQRVHQLLTEKFNLFSGVFGASDEVLGAIESNIDFERRVLDIYQRCRTPAEIDAAFDALQSELDEQINSRMAETRKALLENFDSDVHARLKLRLADTERQLDTMGQQLWSITRHVLADDARFDDAGATFDLERSPHPIIAPGRYHMIRRGDGTDVPDGFLYRLSHPLGEHVIDQAKAAPTPIAALHFDISHHPTRMAQVEALRGQAGWLTLRKLTVQSFEAEEHLLFSGMTDDGDSLDQEQCEKLFQVAATEHPASLSEPIARRLDDEAGLAREAALNRSMEANGAHFAKAAQRLEQWAADKLLGEENKLQTVKEQIFSVRRELRAAATLAAQTELQQKLADLEKRQRRLRQTIFDVEDEIAAERDRLIEKLRARLAHGHVHETLFTIRWEVV